MAAYPQAALEKAVVAAIIAGNITSPGTLNGDNVARTFDGQPPPKMGNWFVGVWSDNQMTVENTNTPSYLGEQYHVFITVTRRVVQPYDRWYKHRDELEEVRERIKPLLVIDELNNVVIRAANTIAEFDDFSDSQPTRHVGFRGFFTLEGSDPIQKVNASWWHAEITQPEKVEFGLVQKHRWGRVKRIQAIGTAS